MTMPVTKNPDRREIAELQAKINLLLAMASMTDDGIARLQGDLRHRDAEIAGLQDGLHAKAVEIETLTRSVADLSQHLAALRASTSWRLTAPLRWLSSRVRR